MCLDSHISCQSTLTILAIIQSFRVDNSSDSLCCRYYEMFKSPLEMKHEQCENSAPCDYYSEIIGFQAAYSLVFGRTWRWAFHVLIWMESLHGAIGRANKWETTLVSHYWYTSSSNYLCRLSKFHSRNKKYSTYPLFLEASLPIISPTISNILGRHGGGGNCWMVKSLLSEQQQIISRAVFSMRALEATLIRCIHAVQNYLKIS